MLSQQVDREQRMRLPKLVVRGRFDGFRGDLSLREQDQPVMLSEVLEVLQVQGRERQAMHQAAGSNPGVVG